MTAYQRMISNKRKTTKRTPKVVSTVSWFRPSSLGLDYHLAAMCGKTSCFDNKQAKVAVAVCESISATKF